MPRGDLRRGRRRGRRRTMMVMGAMNKRGNDDEGEPEQEEQVEQQTSESGSGLTDNSVEQLEKLAELKDKGILTEEEFQAKKKEILGL
jgi:hypothetical protein